MTVEEPFTRQSTLLQLSRKPIGRPIRPLIALPAKSAATTKDEARLFARRDAVRLRLASRRGSGVGK
ncbi:hypothetical protein OG921_03965 [Aldersonia sp. NBC_00410]|uniref:hypothetical protein n=1 Tax=Aldersonia sp. NBC_00410 TaxID=2975954 RepID=UPI00224FC308|nr:hypothetical protein [Aldersonia sp. NBC_00410]MCX5042343.1 hypothetical protein [Aldersonia sp. NBC_00410]